VSQETLGRGKTYIFETYLLHASLIALLWIPWKVLVGGASDPSYFTFFVLAPFAAILVGSIVGRARRSSTILLICAAWPDRQAT
jgi:hypothetical protein